MSTHTNTVWLFIHLLILFVVLFKKFSTQNRANETKFWFRDCLMLVRCHLLFVGYHLQPCYRVAIKYKCFLSCNCFSFFPSFHFNVLTLTYSRWLLSLSLLCVFFFFFFSFCSSFEREKELYIVFHLSLVEYSRTVKPRNQS